METMPKKGDVFVGKINDLSQFDAAGWKRRDIWFYKNEINRNEKFDYPARKNTITLIDAEKKRYELNFSKPDLENKVCLGTPSHLKPWYKKVTSNPVCKPTRGDGLAFTPMAAL